MTDRHIICRDCGFIGSAKTVMKGNKSIERLLYWTLLIPGPFYTLWRRMTKTRLCPKCGGQNIVDVDSAEGRLLLDEQLRKF